jgi:hypothetical protein
VGSSGLTYHVVFDISERFPEAAIGVVAVVCLLAVLALALIPRWRPVLRRTSGLWLAAAGLLFGVLGIHNIGVPYGLLFGVFSLVAFVLAFAAWRDLDLTMRDGSLLPSRSAAPIGAAVLLLLTSLAGCQQFTAFGLANKLAAGDATVVSGTVQDFTPGGQGWNGGTKGPECFTVSAHRYCYNFGGFSPLTVGFHWTRDNGGPIHDGLQVRVSSIGDVIVRLEIADGQ